MNTIFERIAAHSDASSLRRFSLHGRHISSRHSGKASINPVEIIAVE